MCFKCGIKELIDDYVEIILELLMYIYYCLEKIIFYVEKLDFFCRVSYCYGCFVLLFSGGVGLIYFYYGVVQELIDYDLLLNVIFGVSVGFIVLV